VSAEKKDGPRDWDKELADIDKLISSSGGNAPPPLKMGGPPARRAEPAPTAGAAAAARPPAAAPDRPAAGRFGRLFTWLRLALALAVGIGMTQWPYTHGCDWSLVAYLGGVATVIVAAFWSAVSSWRTRAGLAHFLSIALLFWGAGLAAREVLRRVGYAKQGATWRCVARPVTHAPAPVSAPATSTPQPRKF